MPSVPPKQRASVPQSIKLFIAQGCPNCQRMVETLKSIPALHPVTSVVDVRVTPYRGVTHVPSLLVNESKLLSGTAAFEYLRGFDAELSDPVGLTGLGFSFIGSEPSDSNEGTWYSAFNPV